MIFFVLGTYGLEIYLFCKKKLDLSYSGPCDCESLNAQRLLLLSSRGFLIKFKNHNLNYVTFPNFVAVTCFLLLDANYMHFRAYRGFMFSRALNWFPALVTGFGAGYMFSYQCHLFHVFPRLPPVTCFPSLACEYMLLRRVLIGLWHHLHHNNLFVITSV